MNGSCRILVTDFSSRNFLERVHRYSTGMPIEIIAPDREGLEALLEIAPQAEAILCYKEELTKSVIHAASSLKFIQKHGVNCKNIDLTAAKERGIPVGTIPLMRSASVAEQALALMLACTRKVIPGHKAVAEAEYLNTDLEPIQTSQWNFVTNWTEIQGISELFGASIGIVGLGDVGMEIANRCRPFNMEVNYFQRNPHPKEVETRWEATYLPLDDLLASSDYVVLAIPHTPESEGIIGTDQLQKMKPTATLINVGRGGLIDETALYNALANNKIAMAGLDVYRYEPLPESNPLRTLPNIVFSSHLGGGSYRSWAVDLPASLDNILRFFRGEVMQGLIR